MANICDTSNGIDNGLAWLNTPMTHPPVPQDATLVGAKELSNFFIIIFNSALVHVDYKHFRCINLKDN
jgi:hypothetical protein